ncbi:MAG TPA: dihydrodipicolinate synthase family protein [Stellaceae bacterium]|jgi:4-hydroxy-tetrahydrodipicolinate synthase
MPSYRKNEARDWAWQHLKGCANVIIPSYTADLKGLNERGIRHDVRQCLEHGFTGTLLVSETAVTLSEYAQFFEWSNDESKGRLKLILHASFNALEENIEAAKIAEANGCELVLLSYPANFYPETLDEIYEYTKAFCDATNLAILLFPVPLWGFSRLHPSDIPASVIRKLLDNCRNIVAIKAEGGMPSIMGFVECHRLFGKEVIVETPLFGDLVPLAQLVPIQFTGTSNTHFFGSTVPHVMELLQQKKFDEATEIYWRTAPARQANGAVNASSAGGHFLNRMVWGYEGWLQGYNGGPLRQPTMKIHGQQMSMLRSGLTRSGLKPTESPDKNFFVGRNPVETVSSRSRAAAE